MKLSRFESVKTRLLALMVFVLLPIMILSIILATTSYRSVLRQIELSELELASNYAVRARVWFRGILRSAVTSTAAIEAAHLQGAPCDSAMSRILQVSQGFQASLLVLPDGTRCYASTLPHLSQDILLQLQAQNYDKPTVNLWAGASLGQARYDAVTIHNHLHLMVYVKNGSKPSENTQTVFIVDPKLLDQAFEIGSFDKGTIVAVMKRGSQILVSRGIAETDKSWLPVTEVISENVTIRTDKDQSEFPFRFAVQMINEADLYVLARFNGQAARAAFMQFLILCFTPAIMILLLG
jgi:two-component system, sensor histidine kinase PdtaS